MKRMFKTIAVFLAAVIVFSAVSGGDGLSLKAYAANGNTFTDPNGIVWTVDVNTGTLTISGEGAMKDAGCSPLGYDGASTIGPLGQYVKIVVIESGITHIANNAFWFPQGNSQIESISIPGSVTSIGTGAFRMSRKLSSLTVPDGCSVGEYAFSGCPLLEGISEEIIASGTLGESVDWTINNTGVLDISGTGVIPESVPFSPSFPREASVTDVIIGEGITEIEDGAFYNSNYNYISYVSLPGSLVKIGSNAFDTCERLSHVYYNGLQEDWAHVEGSDALLLPSSCTIDFMEPVDSGSCGPNLNWAYYPNGRLEITGTGDMSDYDYSGSNVSPWNDYESEMSIIVIGPGVTSIGNYAFYDCRATSLVIQDANLVIKDEAFWNNYLTEIDWGTGSVKIGYSPFNQSVMLESLVLPANISLTEDSVMAFANGVRLKTVDVQCEIVGREMFYNCKKLSSVTLGQRVRTLDYEAFYGNSSLGIITIPAGVNSIGRRVFLNSGLHHIYFEGTDFSCITDVGSGYNMWNYGSGVTVHAPECSKAHYMANLYHNNFAVLDGSQTGHVYPETPSWSWDANHFTARVSFICSSHQDSSISAETDQITVTYEPVPGSNGRVYYRIYHASAELNGVTYYGEDREQVPYSVLLHGNCGDPSVNHGRNLVYEFNPTTGVLTFTGSGNMKNYTENDRAPWVALGFDVKSVVFGTQVTSVGTLAFEGCVLIQSVELPESMRTLAANAFSGCVRLSEITIPATVETIIGDFSGSQRLTDIYYYGSQEEWAAYGVETGEGVTVHYLVFHPAAYVVLSSDTVVYDGVNRPEVSVYLKDGAALPEGTLLTEGSDYTLEFTNADKVGRATAVVTGMGSYSGVIETEYTITARPVSLNELYTSVYNGAAQTAEIVPTADNVEGLVEGDRLFLENAVITGTDVGIYTDISAYTWRVEKADGTDVTENYELTVNAEFEITRAPAEALGLYAVGYNAPYDGEAHGITVHVNVPERTTIYYSLMSPLDPTFSEDYWQEEAPSWTEWTDGAIPVYVKAVNPNFFSPMHSASVEITKRPVRITIADAEKNVGEPDPVFPDAVLEGGVGDELADIDLSVHRIGAGSNEEPGRYLNKLVLPMGITESWLNANYSNYIITVRNGTFIIKEEPLVITGQPQDVRAKKRDLVVFEVSSNKTGASYRWYYSKDDGRSWLPCTGSYATQRRFTGFRMSENLDGRLYRCIVTYDVWTYEQEISRAAKLILDDGTPLPIALTAENTANSILVSWSMESAFDTGPYDIWRKEEGGSFVKISASPAGANGLADTDVVFGTKYTYKVTKGPENAPTSASNEVSIIRNPFTDVPESASYFNRLVWAVNSGIISGTSKTTFSPNNDCTRYQFAVMIYKLAGKPKVTGVTLPFTDVPADASYYNAVAWAYSNGIISGTSKTTFSPMASVTRYQVVAMLYKMKGKPAVSGTLPFEDVPSDASYYKAVLWAVQNKITSGTNATTFSPMAPCQRYQMVVFLEKFSKLK